MVILPKGKKPSIPFLKKIKKNLKEACKAAGASLSANEQMMCQTANSTGLKFAMAVTASIFLVASACFLLCARTLKADFVAQLGGES